MPINFLITSDDEDTVNKSPFYMYDIIEYPDHLDNIEKRKAFYDEVVEVFDLISDINEVDEFENKYMEDIKYLGNYKYKVFQTMIAEKRLNFIGGVQY